MAGNLPIKFNIPIAKTQATIVPQLNLPPPVVSPVMPPQLNLPIPNISQNSENIGLSSLTNLEDIKSETEKFKAETKEKLSIIIDNENIINKIVGSINEGNIDAARIICQHNQFIRPEHLNDLINILRATNKTNIETTKLLCKNKNFTKFENIGYIEGILKNTNEITGDFIEKLCRDKKFTEHDNMYYLYWLITSLSDKNIDFAKWLVQKEIYENSQGGIGRIFQILNSLLEESISSWENSSKSVKLRYIKDIVEEINDENSDFAKWLWESKDFWGNPNYKQKELIKKVPYICRAVNKSNEDFAKFICQNSLFQIQYTSSIIGYTNEENRDFARWLCENKRFATPGRLGNIKDILAVTNKHNADFAKWLCESENFAIEYTEDEANYIKFITKQLEFVKECDTIKYISDIIEKVNETNQDFAKIICSDERFKSFRRSDNILYIGRIIENSDVTKETQEYKLNLLLELAEIAEKKKQNFIALPDLIKAITPENKQEFYKYLNLGIPFTEIAKILTSSSENETNSIKYLERMKAAHPKEYSESNIDSIWNFLEHDFSSKKISEKIRSLHYLTNFTSSLKPSEETIIDEVLTKKTNEINYLLLETISTYATNKEDMQKFIMEFIWNRNNSNSDEILSSKEFEEYLNKNKKEGITLKFSRKEFLEKLKEILNNTEPEQIEEILDKIEINLVYATENKEMTNVKNATGFDGIINDKKLDENNKTEKELKELIIKFVFENEVQTGNEKFDYLLNQLIKAFPEAVNIIGKKQHQTHDSTLDIHTLKVLNYAMNTEEYKTLSDNEKLILKFIILFHDIAKAENQADENHPEVCAFYTRDILNKINLPENMKERIIEIIKNHNILGKLNENQYSGDIEYATAILRREGDIKLAKIFTEADIHCVNETFAQEVNAENLDNIIKKLYEKLDERHHKGALAYSTPFIQTLFKKSPYYNKALTEIEKNGKTYKVPIFNFSGDKSLPGLFIDKNFDLRELGFINQYDKNKPLSEEDLELFIHCTYAPQDVYYLGSVEADSDICTSNITPIELNTFNDDDTLGVVFNPFEQYNISSSNNTNQNSGAKKNTHNFATEMFRDSFFHKVNDFTRIYFIKYFEENCNMDITETQFAQIHKQLQNYKYLTQVHDIKLQDGTILKEEDIKNAIKYIGKKRRADYKHTNNETNVLIHSIMSNFVSGKYAEDIPEKCLESAEKNNVPIFLFKTGKK